MIQEWLYKATPAMVSKQDTSDLAINRGFLCRSAYEHGGKHARADFTQEVQLGHVIHFYYSDRHGLQPIGSFEVIKPKGTDRRFGPNVSSTGLFEVTRGPFRRHLLSLSPGRANGMGYLDDPVLNELMGWVIASRTNLTPPKHSVTRFASSRRTLVPVQPLYPPRQRRRRP